MQVVRTPDERFAGLPDWPWVPRYIAIPDGSRDGPAGELRMHYIDEGGGAGPRAAAPVLCLHGQPTWSYLYRRMIPLLLAGGQRVVAPDLVGFGRSDKPTRPEDYSYAGHVAWLRSFVEGLDLTGITLVCQDWGGLLGLRVLAEIPERFARVVVSNTGLPDASQVADADVAATAAALRAQYAALPVPMTMLDVAQGFMAAASGGAPPFMYWQKHAAESPQFTAANVLRLQCPRLTAAEVAAYAAPFPDEAHMAGARRFPSLVPIIPDDVAVAANRAAWARLREFHKPFLTAFTDSDPVTAGQHLRFRKEVPGAAGQPHTTIVGAGHFVQEDAGAQLAGIVLDLIRRT